MSEETAPYIVGIPNPNAAWTGRATSDHTFTGIPPTTSQKMAYIPTVFTVPPELNVGEIWYIKYQQGFCGLTEVEIKEVTEKTVVLQSLDSRLGYECGGNKPVRYKKLDIEFVEKVEDNEI
jgi:hypothetical protein